MLASLACSLVVMLEEKAITCPYCWETIHIDLDLYEGYRDTLEHLYKHVVPGGVVLFDEYIDAISTEKWPGPKRAIREFLGDEVDRIQRDPVIDKYYLEKR